MGTLLNRHVIFLFQIRGSEAVKPDVHRSLYWDMLPFAEQSEDYYYYQILKGRRPQTHNQTYELKS